MSDVPQRPRIVSPSAPTTIVSLNDPALDRTSRAYDAAAVVYLRSRHPDDRAALPVLTGETLAEYVLDPLSLEALRWCERAETDVIRFQRAFRCACFVWRDSDGHEHKATGIDRGAGFPEAPDVWLEASVQAHGLDAVLEVGAVALQRAHVHPRARDPFSWPRGVRLGV